MGLGLKKINLETYQVNANCMIERQELTVDERSTQRRLNCPQRTPVLHGCGMFPLGNRLLS